MLFQKIFIGTAYFLLDIFKAVPEDPFVFGQPCIHKPRSPIFQREMLDDASAQSYFYILYRGENQCP